MSETASSRSILAPYCVGKGIDCGFGGDLVVPHAWAYDMVGGSYGAVGQDRQQLRGDCRKFPWLCDNALDFIYSSHLLEDFYFSELLDILKEWRRVLREGAVLVLNCPDQSRFEAHCAKTGQGLNLNHKEKTFSLATFRKVLDQTGKWEEVYCLPDHPPYSWLLVVKKV